MHAFSANHAGMVILVPLHCLSEAFMMVTLHFQNVALFTTTLGINIALATAIFSFHALGSVKALLSLLSSSLRKHECLAVPHAVQPSKRSSLPVLLWEKEEEGRGLRLPAHLQSLLPLISLFPR